MDPVSLPSAATGHTHGAAQGHVAPLSSPSSSSSSTSAAALSAVAGNGSSALGVGSSSAVGLPKATKTAQDTLLKRTRAADLIATRAARSEIVRQKQLALAAHRGVLAARVPQPSGSADYSRGGGNGIGMQGQAPPSPLRPETLNLDASGIDKSGFSCGGVGLGTQAPAQTQGLPPVTPLATTELGAASPYPDGALMSPESLSETRSLLTAVLVPRDSAPPDFTPNSSVVQMASADGTLSPEAMPLPMDLGQHDSGSGDGSTSPSSFVGASSRNRISSSSSATKTNNAIHVPGPSSSEDFAEAFKYAVQADAASTTSTTRRQRQSGRTLRTSTAPAGAAAAATTSDGQMLRLQGDYSREISSASAGRHGGCSMVSGTNMKFSGTMASSGSGVVGGHSWSRHQWVNSVADAAAARTPGVVSEAASWASSELGMADEMPGDGDGDVFRNRNTAGAADAEDDDVAPRPISGVLRGARRYVPLALRGMRHQRQRSSRGVYGGDGDGAGSVGGGNGLDSSALTWNAGLIPLLQDGYSNGEEPAAAAAEGAQNEGGSVEGSSRESREVNSPGNTRSPNKHIRPPRSPPEPLGDLYTLAEGSMGSATGAEATVDGGGGAEANKQGVGSALPALPSSLSSHQRVASQLSRPGKRREPRGPGRAGQLSSAMACMSLDAKKEEGTQEGASV